MKRPRFLFVVPNLFTVSSIFCGVYAIAQATESSIPDRFFRAAVAILFAILFDAADGRVARMTKTESDFGVQLDSLADVISFGVAPAILVYKWSLTSFGILGLVVAFIYAACGAMRLARFNVMAAQDENVPHFFLGLPIPLAAAGIASLVLVHYHFLGGTEPGQQTLIMAVVVLLSLLMVSHVRYRTFKKIKIHWRAVPTLVVLITLVFVATYFVSFSVIFAVFCAAFVTFGLAEEVFRFLRRHLHGTEEDEEEEEEEEAV